MGIIAKPGDIFTIPIDDVRYGVGLVACRWNSELLILVYDDLSDGTLVPEHLDSHLPLLGSSSLDAKIWHGHWKVIGSLEIACQDLQPFYKIETPKGWFAESFDRTIQLPIDQKTSERLRFRKCVAPVRLEKALKAHFGIGEWNEIYDELLYQNIAESRELVSSFSHLDVQD